MWVVPEDGTRWILKSNIESNLPEYKCNCHRVENVEAKLNEARLLLHEAMRTIVKVSRSKQGAETT